ncbi:sigma E protease regulator RseP [soil metagenome]
MLEAILPTIVLLSVLILIHELGHFVAAKSVDIEVHRFSLGMGPRVLGFRVGETEFVLSALPIGGYVSMAGMAGDEGASALEGGGDAPHEPSPRDFDAKPLWARVWVVSAGVLMNLLFAVLVFALIPLFYGERIDPTREIVVDTRTLPAAAAPLAQVPFGAEITTVNERPVATWNEVTRALIEAGTGAITLQFADAPAVTFRMPVQDSLRAAVLGAIRPVYEPVLGQVRSGEAAAAAGLLPGDRIVAAAGEPIRTWWEFQDAIRAHPGVPLPLEVERGAERVSLTVTPSAEREPGLGVERIGRLGVAPDVQVIHRSVGPGEAMQRGVQDTWQYSRTIVAFLGNLFTGQESPRQVGSVITIGQLSGEFARAGLQPFLWFMAVFSINLAVLNLLPIPILDGGHLMFMAIEAVRGRPLSVEQRVRFSHVGLIIVVGIMVWALTNDVLRVFGI